MTDVSKSQPTPSDVHTPTIMGEDRRRRRKQMRSEYTPSPAIRVGKRAMAERRMKLEVEFAKRKQPLKDPKGGLTSAGRAHFKRTEGANLKPGVKGAADTPDKMRRKGSFLTRFFTNPSGPLQDDKGRPTRLALSANAWGEPVPKNAEDAARLAAKGRRLLERYESVKKEQEQADPGWGSVFR